MPSCEPDPTLTDPPCDFIAFLSDQLRVAPGAALRQLSVWMGNYEPRCAPVIAFGDGAARASCA